MKKKKVKKTNGNTKQTDREADQTREISDGKWTKESTYFAYKNKAKGTPRPNCRQTLCNTSNTNLSPMRGVL